MQEKVKFNCRVFRQRVICLFLSITVFSTAFLKPQKADAFTITAGAVGAAVISMALVPFLNGYMNELGGELANSLLDMLVNGTDDEFISTLSSTTASSGIAVTGFTVSQLDGSEHYLGRPLYYGLYQSDQSKTIELLKKSLVPGKFIAVGVTAEYLFGYEIRDGYIYRVSYPNPLGVAHASALGVYDNIDSSTVYSGRALMHGGGSSTSVIAFPSTEAAHEYFGDAWLTSEYYVYDLDNLTSISWDSSYAMEVWQFNGYLYKSALNSVETVFESLTSFKMNRTDLLYENGSFSGSVYDPSIYRPKKGCIEWDNSHIIVQPSGTDSSSRTSDLMEMISDYNRTNDFLNDDTVVNYYIGTINADGSTEVFDIGIFDEDTMIFTEPESGTEYQANGWEYDYTTRTYTITFDDGVLTMDDKAVTSVLYTLGDEACVLSYYNGETLVKQVAYDYLMVSQNECNVTGHTYTYENVSDPTCIAAGERKYTCSTCGNEYAEEIPATGHAMQFSIMKEATCLAEGLGLYTCSTCGMEYTEAIPKKDHAAVLLETVPSEYDENGIIVSVGYSVYECSVCGTQYTVKDTVDDDSNWFEDFVESIKSFAKSAFSMIGKGLGKVFSGFTNLISGVFSFLNDTVVRGVKDFFSGLSDSSITDVFQQENEDGTTTVTLPGGMASGMSAIAGFFTGLPSDLSGILMFGIALMFLLAALKLFL